MHENTEKASRMLREAENMLAQKNKIDVIVNDDRHFRSNRTSMTVNGQVFTVSCDLAKKFLAEAASYSLEEARRLMCDALETTPVADRAEGNSA